MIHCILGLRMQFGASHNNNEEHILSEVDQDMEPEHIDSSGNSSDDNNNVGVPIMQGAGLRRKHHRAWTLSEVTKLVEGVSKYGAGKWSEIKKLSFSSHSYRTSVDLKVIQLFNPSWHKPISLGSGLT